MRRYSISRRDSSSAILRSARRMGMGRFVLLLFCVCSFCLLFVPFLNKAYHIDDVTFLDFAIMIDWNPLKAIPTDYPYMGGMLPHFLLYEGTHPPFVPYFMKIIMALFGGKEIVMHAAFLIFPVIALISLARLTALLFPESEQAFVLVPLFFMTIPVFLVNAHNVMTDVPTLAFIISSLFWYCSAMERDRPLHSYVGAIFLSAAVFSSYQTVVFIPLIYMYFWKRKRLHRSAVLSLFIPVLLLFVWIVSLHHLYGLIPILKSNIALSKLDIASEIGRGYSAQVFAGKLISIFANIGTSLFIVLMVYAYVSQSLKRLSVGFLVITVICSSVIITIFFYPLFETVMLSCLTAAGILSVAEAFALARKDRHFFSPRIFLLVIILTVIGYNIVILPFGSARYILPAIPPLLMLLLCNCNWTLRQRTSKIVLSFALAMSLAFGFAQAYADYALADSYRKFGSEIQQFRSNVKRTFDVWYVGEWGMRYYMDRNGGRYLFHDSQDPKKGDYVVLAMMPRQWQPSLQVTERLMLYATREYELKIPLRLFNLRANAGFYGHYWGLLPVSFSHEPLESFEIWEVVR